MPLLTRLRNEMPDLESSKTVFISYRRSAHKHLSMMLFKDLRDRGFDPFRDSDTIGAGDFERIILHEIGRRTHFIVLLSFGTLERCSEPGDWLRLEIEYALDTSRNIIPVLVDGFKFTDAEPYLTGKLAKLKAFQAQPLYTEEVELYEVGLNKIANQKLQLPVYVPPSVSLSLPAADAKKVEEIIEAAVEAPRPTQEELTAEQWAERALGKLLKGDFPGAIADYSEAILLNPNYVEVYNYRGNVWAAQGKMEEAVEDYSKSLELKPDDASTYNSRAVIRADQGDIAGALNDYDKALGLNPDFAWVYSNRGELFFTQQKYGNALTDFTKAWELNPHYLIALAGIAISEHALGRMYKAKQAWRELSDKDVRYRDVEWMQRQFNWAEPLVEEARKLIATL